MLHLKMALYIVGATMLGVGGYHVLSESEVSAMEGGEVTSGSGIDYIEYRLTGAKEQDWTTYTSSVNIAEAGLTVLSARAFDYAGNISETIFEIINIESEFPDGVSGIKKVEYRLSGAVEQAWTEYTAPIEITTPGTTVFTTRAFDNAGNISKTIFEIVNIGSKLLDGISGINRVEYQLTGAVEQGWTDYTSPVEISTPGVTVLSARAYDNADNLSKNVFEVVNIGNTYPDGISGINRVEYSLTGAVVQGWQEYTSPIEITTPGVTIFSAKTFDNAGNVSELVYEFVDIDDGTFIDVGSEIDKIEYRLSGATEKDWVEYTDAFKVTNEGITTIEARAIDEAGNVSAVASTEVKVDKTAPNGGVTIKIK